ncbi:MAG: serine protease [Armatimonadota bacterium]
MSRALTAHVVIAAVCSTLALVFAPALAQADEQGAAARAVSAAASDAVVQVRIVVKYRMAVEGEEAQEEEGTNEVTATIVDPSGLAVCALSEVDPSHRMKMMAEQEDGYKFEADVIGVHYIIGEGKEIAGKVVLRDPDLDLAFLRPSEAPAEPFKAVDLAQSSTPQVMDELVVLGRLSEVANRAPYVGMDRVTAIVSKPRTLYIAGIGTWIAGLGVPAFTLDGKLVGITVMRSIPSAAGSSEEGGASSMPVLLPAADVLKSAQQAPAS